MSFSVRPVVAALLLAGAATLLAACDYAKYSPGMNPQFKDHFGNPPGYTNAEINRDSINYKQDVYKPTGVGSAASLKTASPTAQINSEPAGSNSVQAQNASGTPGSVNTADPNNAASTSPAANGMGNGENKPPKK